MKKTIMASLFLLSAILTSCNAYREESGTADTLGTADTVEAITETPVQKDPIELLLDQIPELAIIGEYIEKQSARQAHIVMEASEIPELSAKGYQRVYVGKEWEDGHRVHWYWFDVSVESGLVLAVLNGGSDPVELEEWRSEFSYMRRMDLIQGAIDNETVNREDLDCWIGTYHYSVQYEEEKEVRYKVTIYKVLRSYYASIGMIGNRCHIELDGIVKGNAGAIDIICHNVGYVWSDSNSPEFSRGDVLFSLSGDWPEIETHWNVLGSVLDSHRESDGRCFMLQTETNYNLAEGDSTYLNLIELDDPKQAEAVKTYNEFLNGRSYVQYEGYTKLMADMDCEYFLYDINGDGIQELILSGGGLQIIACGDSGLYMWMSDQYYGGQKYFVNDGNLYYRHGGIANILMHSYEELDINGECIRRINVDAYASPGNDPDCEEEYVYTYIYSEGEEEREITEAEYEELVNSMSNDDEIEWIPYYPPESTLRYLR